VDAALLAAHGPVHPDVARQMAVGIRTVTAHADVRTDVGLSTTGVAGPDPADGQAVGTVYVGVSTPDGVSVVSLALDGDRETIRRATVRRALQAAIDAL
jgi:nicotinamide-nucleotide amidase